LKQKIDGGEQFSHCKRFWFSKNPTETLEIWDKEKVLADVLGHTKISTRCNCQPI
jgi:hypothetical protein